jgi:hypothetical protein
MPPAGVRAALTAGAASVVGLLAPRPPTAAEVLAPLTQEQVRLLLRHLPPRLPAVCGGGGWGVGQRVGGCVAGASEAMRVVVLVRAQPRQRRLPPARRPPAMLRHPRAIHARLMWPQALGWGQGGGHCSRPASPGAARQHAGPPAPLRAAVTNLPVACVCEARPTLSDLQWRSALRQLPPLNVALYAQLPMGVDGVARIRAGARLRHGSCPRPPRDRKAGCAATNTTRVDA